MDRGFLSTLREFILLQIVFIMTKKMYIYIKKIANAYSNAS